MSVVTDQSASYEELLAARLLLAPHPSHDVHGQDIQAQPAEECLILGTFVFCR